MQIVDTHCHIHQIVESELNDPTHEKWKHASVTDAAQVIADAGAAGVGRLVCVGTDVEDSQLAVEFVQDKVGCWASIGIHPHEARRYANQADEAVTQRLAHFEALAARPKVVAVGECGLDYFYNHSTKDDQEKILRFQIELALKHDLPMVFHVREAFGDFWPIFDSYHSVGGAGDAGQKIRGVIHSFSAGQRELEAILARGLYVGVNGIATFAKDEAQIAAFKEVPIERMLIETDAPYLTPTPYRGSICESKHAATTLSFVAQLQGITDQDLASVTTQNAHQLFDLA